MVDFGNQHVSSWRILLSKPFQFALYLVPLTIFTVYHFKTSSNEVTNRGYVQMIHHRLSQQKLQLMDTENICKSAFKQIWQVKHDLNSVCLGYSLNNPSICKDGDNILALIVVYSVAKNFKNRERLRQTVGNRSILPASIRIVYIIGFEEEASLQKQIIQEHNTHGDTIQGKFIDSFKNSSAKFFMGFKWVTEYCQNVEFVIKLDDDIMVDMFYLLVVTLPPFIGIKQILICDGEKDLLTYHYKNNKWYSDYHRNKCVAQAFVMTSDLVPILYESAVRNPPFWRGDVFRKRLPGHNSYRSCFDEREKPCLFVKGDENVLVKFWINAYKRRYDFIAKAFDNLEEFEGF